MLRLALASPPRLVFGAVSVCLPVGRSLLPTLWTLHSDMDALSRELGAALAAAAAERLGEVVAGVRCDFP